MTQAASSNATTRSEHHVGGIGTTVAPVYPTASATRHLARLEGYMMGFTELVSANPLDQA